MAAYRIVDVSLTTVKTKEPLEGGLRNAQVEHVAVLELPTGSQISLHFGEGGQAVPLLNQGMNFELCPPENDGIYVTVPSVQAGTVKLLISFLGGPQAQA